MEKLNATAFVYPGNGKDVQPLAAWQRCSSSRLALSRKNKGLPFSK
jgi:hypothetical protein